MPIMPGERFYINVKLVFSMLRSPLTPKQSTYSQMSRVGIMVQFDHSSNLVELASNSCVTPTKLNLQGELTRDQSNLFGSSCRRSMKKCFWKERVN